MAIASICDIERKTLYMVADIVEERYVLEEDAIRVAKTIRKQAKNATAQQNCDPSSQFASNVTDELRKISGDGHFYLEASADEGEDDWIAEWISNGKYNGYGVERVEILEENIGIVKISTFYDMKTAFDRFEAAFKLVEDTQGLILDLRGNGGGSSETEWPLQWTFLEPGTEVPLRLESRFGDVKDLVEPKVPWLRYGSERPLAILLDDRSFSAPEAIAFSLQSIGRAVVIGSKSGGGAHMLGTGIPLSTGFKLHVPEIRPVASKSGLNWEAVGVTPDIVYQGDDIVKVAIKELITK
ncbi:S41 family peptidase [Arenicella sp. 4NH20-0111]|uniref:S41 family peptidase n=1 Tax=Arenicella sp. 4NH20-0111 TaxID=3127648 RepID=UPI00333E971B